MRTVLSVVSVAAWLLLTASRSDASPILGGQLYYSGGDVTVTTLPASSGFVSELGLYDAALNRLRYLASDEPAGVSVTFDPGAQFGFVAGQELILGIRVVSDRNREYFLGPAGRNPDGVMHAMLDTAGAITIAFEDLFGGGDRDYNDARFRIDGAGAAAAAVVSEPAALAMLGAGFALMAVLRRRRTTL